MSAPEPESLNARRDAYLSGVRALMRRMSAVELEEVRGILTRVEDVLDTQGENLSRLAALDLDAPPDDAGEAISTLIGAQHLPRMVICFSRVLLQDAQDPRLTAFEPEAADLGRDLALLTQEWVTRHAELIDDLGDDGEYV